MPYLNLDLDWFSHPKAIRLVGLLGHGAELYPIKLWAYVGKHHADTGRLVNYSEAEIEAICGWLGEPGRLAQTFLLPQINLLERHEDFFQVHDWIEHSGHLAAFKKRAKSAAKKRWGRYATSIAKYKRKQYPSRGMVGIVKTGKVESSEGGLGETKTVFPEWLDPDVWRGYQNHRAAMPKKHHLTANAEKLAIIQLGKWAAAGHDPNEIIRTSIMNGWVGLFEPRRQQAPPQSVQQEGQLSDRTLRILRRGL